MSDNKFIERLKGKNTSKSVLEISNEATKTSFANMPSGTSNAIDVYSDYRADATAVLNGTINWKISNSNLILANDVAGDGTDFSSTYSVSGAGLWIDSVYTFPSTGDPAHPVAMVFNPSTKWVLKVCGDNLIVDGGYIADFTLLVKIGTSNIFTKTFSVAEQAGQFCKEFVLDFNETNAGIIKASGLSTLTVQLLCGTANASARIYNGMTVLTCLQRKVDASAVSNLTANVDDLLNAEMIPVEYFSNAAFIDQIADGEQAYAVFERDGDSVDLAGWTPKDAVAYKDEVIIKAEVMPTPNTDLVGAIYQYTGVTSAPYEHGYIYECKQFPQDTLVFTPNTISCSWEDLKTFLEGETQDYDSVVSGTMTYMLDADLWVLDAKDVNGNTVLTYQQYTGDWENVGFTFAGTFVDGAVVTFVRNTTTTYGWERIDVQPGGSRGRFLALWNCATGLAESNPPYSPYEYKTGDYFIVGTVSSATPAVNYKPDGTSYIINQASITVETNEVAVDDTYFFDGTTWRLQSNSNKTVTYSNIAGDIYDNASATTALNAKQNTLVSGTNIKTINSNSVLGSGNLQISGFLPYPAAWTTNSTTKAFCDDIAADSSAVVGTAYLGEVTISDMPAGIANGEIKAYILDGTTAANKVIQLELTSGNVAPYKWIYTYWNGGSNVSGWKTWQEPLVSGTNIKTVNSTSLLGSGNITIDGLPTQTGQSGKYLTTDGSTASWVTVDALPSQTGNNGKLLTTNGTSASWTEIKTINSGSLVGSGNIDVLVNEATPASSLGIGYTTINTTYTDSINIGNGAQVGANNALALGAFASAEGQDSIAIYSSTGTAHRARTTHTGNIAIGYNALAINAAYTIAIGYNAYAQGANSIQLGTGQVTLQNTFQVWTYPMLNKTTGLIPSARLADQTSATQGQALILDANLDGQWTTIATVATSGSYGDLLNKPTIPTVNDATIVITQGGVTKGSFTLNQASGDTIALDAGGSSAVDEIIDYQLPSAGNNYTWYRKYQSGWVEQGGEATFTANGNSIVLPVEMADTHYVVQLTTLQNTNTFSRCYVRDTTYIAVATSGGDVTGGWIVSGTAASS